MLHSRSTALSRHQRRRDEIQTITKNMPPIKPPTYIQRTAKEELVIKII